MSKERSTRQLAFVVDASNADPKGDLMSVMQLARQFSDERIPVTWVVDSPEIARAVRRDDGRDLSDWALPLNAMDSPADDCADPLPMKCLRQLRGEGIEPAVVFAAKAVNLRGRERSLAVLGMDAVVADSSLARSRPLPHGLWQLGVNASLPFRRRWPYLFTRSWGVASVLNEPLTIACVSVARLKANSLRGGQQLSRVIDRCTWAANRGELEVASVRQLVAERTALYANRPQRSILRAA